MLKAVGFVLGLVLAGMVPQHADARPVSYPGGYMAMYSHDSFEDSLMLSYSPSARYAVGLRSDKMAEGDAWLHTLTYNRLLERWNASDSQGNFYLLGGVGFADSDEGDSLAGTVGLEADWETRRVYFAYENRLIGSEALDDPFSQKFRAGVAPYIGDYDDLHTWLMVQFDHRPGTEHEFTVTPFVRLFNTVALGELGISNREEIMFNLTLQF